MNRFWWTILISSRGWKAFPVFFQKLVDWPLPKKTAYQSTALEKCRGHCPSTSWTCSPLENDTRGLLHASLPIFEIFPKIFPPASKFFESGKFKKIEKFYWRVTSSSYYKYYQDFIMRYESKIIICLYNNSNNRKKNRYSNSVEE